MNISVNQSPITGQSFLTADIAAGVLAIPVKNTEQFTDGSSSSNNLIVIGEVGSPNAELVKISSLTDTVINTAGVTKFIHQVGEPVYQVTFDQVQIQSSTSATGTFTTIATIDIQWSADNTVYNDPAGTSSTYYRQRYYNSTTGVYSDYSVSGVGVAETDFNYKTAGYLISLVRKAIGNINLTDDFFLNALNEGRKIANTQFGYGRLQEYRSVFEYPVQMLAGTNYIDLPIDIDFTDTNRTLICARFARQSVAANIPINYVDKKEWNIRSYMTRYSWTNGAVTSGATTITLNSTGGIPAAGSVFIATEDPTQSILQVTYTGNNLLTNTLTGCTGITRNISTNVQVSSLNATALPYFYTVFPDQITGTPRLWFDRFIPTSLQGINLYLDYYKRMDDIVFLSDEIPEHYRDLYIDYLKFAVKRRRDDSLGLNDDSNGKSFIQGLNVINGNSYTGQIQIITQ